MLAKSPAADPLMPRGEAFPPTIQQRLAQPVKTLETVAGIVLTLGAVYLHVIQSRSAGGLWRDEVVSIQVAQMPTFGQLWRYLEFDSYPALFHVLLRAWATLFSASDVSLRALGLLIGIGVLGCLWLAARAMGIRTPLLALALLGFNPMVIRYGDSIRAYGLGCGLALLTLIAIWRAVSSARLEWRRFALATAVAILSVQCLYHDAALLLAGCLGGAVVALWQRRVKVAAATMAIGIPAAVSLLPYLPTIARTRRWSVLLKFPITPAWLWEKVCAVTGAPDPIGIWVWSGLVVVGLGLVSWMIFHGRKTNAGLFAASTLAASCVTYACFLVAVSYVTQAWYYLGFLTVVAFCLDVIFGQPSIGPELRLLRVAVVTAFAAITFTQSGEILRTRSTNLDRVAASLNAAVSPGDLVLVRRWECAITLNRYYHRSAQTLTVPPIDDRHVHRYDLFMKCMETRDPLRPVREAVRTTLQQGARVWFVGNLNLPEAGEVISPLPPVWVQPGQPWPFGVYVETWEMEADMFLYDHALHGQKVDVQPGGPVSELEDEPLTIFSGWQDATSAPP